MEFRSASLPRSRHTFKASINKQEIVELKKTVAYLEKYLIKVSDERDRTVEKLKAAVEFSETLEVKLKYEQRAKEPLREEICQLQQEITDLNLRIFTQQEQNAAALKEQLEGRRRLEGEIQRLGEVGRMAHEEIVEHRRESVRLMKKVKVLFKSIQLPKSCIREVLDPNLGIGKTKELILKIPKIYNENKRLQEENEQLFSKVGKIDSSQDPEFKTLIKDSQGLNFFKNKPGCGKQSCAGNPTPTSNWIPKPIYSALEDFRNKNDAITANAVLSLFYKLNQLWQERENNRIQRLKTKLSKGNHSQTSFFHSKPKPAPSKIREQITKEFKKVSEKVVKIILEFSEASEKSFGEANTQSQLAESLLGAIAEFTDKILLWI